MSGRKLNHRSLLLAAFAVLALATGCRLFRPDADVTSGAASPSDISQASFEADDGEPSKGFGLEDLYPDNLGKTVKRVVSEPPNKKEAKKSFDDADATRIGNNRSLAVLRPTLRGGLLGNLGAFFFA